MRRVVPIAVLLVIAALLFGSAYYMFQAGCAGDLKGGSLGDPAAALRIESNGTALGLIAIFASALAATTSGRGSLLMRSLQGVGAFIIACAAVTYVGIEAEVRGVQSCWSGK